MAEAQENAIKQAKIKRGNCKGALTRQGKVVRHKLSTNRPAEEIRKELKKHELAFEDLLSKHEEFLIGSLRKVDEKPWGRRPEVKIPLSALLCMLHSSSTWSLESENAIFAVQTKRRENVSINLCIFILFKKRIYVSLLRWKLDIP